MSFRIGMNEAQIQKELTEEEDARLAGGGAALHETGPTLFITLGLELEESQYVHSSISTFLLLTQPLDVVSAS